MSACPVVMLATAALASGFGGQGPYPPGYDSEGVQTPHNLFVLLNPLRIFHKLVASIQFHFNGFIPSFLGRILTSLKTLLILLNHYGQRYYPYAPQTVYPPVTVDQPLRLPRLPVSVNSRVPPYNYSWSTLLGGYPPLNPHVFLKKHHLKPHSSRDSSQKNGQISRNIGYLSHRSGSRPLKIGNRSPRLVDRSLKSDKPSQESDYIQQSGNWPQLKGQISPIGDYLSHQSGNQSQKSAERSQKNGSQSPKSHVKMHYQPRKLLIPTRKTQD